MKVAPPPIMNQSTNQNTNKHCQRHNGPSLKLSLQQFNSVIKCRYQINEDCAEQTYGHPDLERFIMDKPSVRAAYSIQVITMQ